MENYIIRINNIDEDEVNQLLFEITFTNIENPHNKFAKYEFDIEEIINKGDNFNKFRNLTNNDKINIFNKFVSDLVDGKNSGELYFVMKNGERSITFYNQYMEFRFSSMTMSSVFYVKITEELKNEFKKIRNFLLNKN